MIQTNIRTIAEQLVEIYYSEEMPWQKTRMHPDLCLDYYYKQIEKGAVRVFEEMGVLLGYYQLWMITNEQANRILEGLPFDANREDVTHGKVAFLANVWIDKSFRGTRVFRALKRMFFEQVRGCECVVGEKQKLMARVRLFKLKGE